MQEPFKPPAKPPFFSPSVSLLGILLASVALPATGEELGSSEMSRSNSFTISTGSCNECPGILLEPKPCKFYSDCGDYQLCDFIRSKCVCQYHAIKYFETPICEGCPTRCSTEDYLTTAMPLALGAGFCFLVAASVVIVCRVLVRCVRRYADSEGGGRDNESLSSMQLWINERLRDRPPRYEEPAVGMSTPIAPPISVAVQENEKPPSYEFAVGESQTASFFESVVDENPPPPYSTVMPLSGGISNPGFEGDVPGDVPGDVSRDLPGDLMGSHSPPGSPPPPMLLTVSQAVALREMLQAEGACARSVPAATSSTSC